MLAQHLRDGENQVGGGRALVKFAGELYAHHLWDQHGDRLSQHSGLSLDSADAPSQHTQTVDHGGVRIGADKSIRVSGAPAVLFVHENYARQIFQIHLMNDAGIGRHDGQIAEGSLAPTQEGVTLFIAQEFQFGIELK